jgi:hypothetical protein
MFGSRRIIQPPKAPIEIFAAADADTPRKTVSAPSGVIRDGLKPPLFGAKINGA